ncbi:MAG TPA: hypothetical protein P5137_13710 [Candidatus Brocadiia bacterium]|mgnify:CR=1 FL=1|nr:hypothetical protein [Candidatus Brocadiia bacterium]
MAAKSSAPVLSREQKPQGLAEWVIQAPEEVDERSTEHRKVTGLCVNCKHVFHCEYLKGGDRHVSQCEEYECGPRARRQAGGAPAAAQPAKTKALGLCSNCDEREVCVYPKPEGGVWRCAEYR